MKKLLIFCLFPIYTWAQCEFTAIDPMMLIGQSVILKSNDASYCKTCKVEFLEDGKFWLSFLYSSNALFADSADSYWGLENDNRWSRSWTVQDDVLHSLC